MDYTINLKEQLEIMKAAILNNTAKIKELENTLNRVRRQIKETPKHTIDININTDKLK